MYLTRMRLNTAKRDTMRAMSRLNWFHGAIEDAFERTSGRKLWRIDKLNGEYYLLIVSATKPDLTDAARQFGYPDGDAPWETLSYDRFLSGLKKGTKWHFRLTANPVMRSFETRALCAHVGTANQSDWLMRKAEKNGFSLREDQFQVVESRRFSFRKEAENGRKVTLLSATFEGVMEIEDPALVASALISGIGRGKAYGQGMMTLMRVS